MMDVLLVRACKARQKGFRAKHKQNRRIDYGSWIAVALPHVEVSDVAVETCLAAITSAALSDTPSRSSQHIDKQ